MKGALMQTADFWDNIFSKGQEGNYSRVEMPDLNDPVLKKALEHFGNVENKTIIDLGCGRGATSLFFAHCGANVITLLIKLTALVSQWDIYELLIRQRQGTAFHKYRSRCTSFLPLPACVFPLSVLFLHLLPSA